MRRKLRKLEDEPFQMAPMIDMVFLLLVFFMTVSTLARDARPEVALPMSGTAAVSESAPPREIITVRDNGRGFEYFWHSKPVTPEQLREQILGRGKSGSGNELLLRGPQDLPWDVWKPILDDCRQAGFREIVFATFED